MPESLNDMPTTELLPPSLFPRPASSHRRCPPALPVVPLTAGPVLRGAALMFQADDALVRFLSYMDGDGSIKHMFGKDFSGDEIHGFRVLEQGSDELSLCTTDPESKDLLQRPLNQRPFLNLTGALVPTDIGVKINTATVTHEGVISCASCAFMIMCAVGTARVRFCCLLQDRLVATRDLSIKESRKLEIDFVVPELHRRAVRQRAQQDMLVCVRALSSPLAPSPRPRRNSSLHTHTHPPPPYPARPSLIDLPRSPPRQASSTALTRPRRSTQWCSHQKANDERPHLEGGGLACYVGAPRQNH